jgi:UDP-glucuronate decarboxylase
LRVLVAGGAGFIGSHLCASLLEQAHQVICLDNLITGRRSNIEGLLDNDAFEFLETNVLDTPALSCDLVLHLASPASPVHYKQHALETMLANSAGTHRLLDLARDSRARFVFASTSEVYGDPLQHPQTEEYWGNVNPIGPRSCYDEAKRYGEALTFEYRRRHGVSASIVRIFNTYGPRMSLGDGRVVPAFAAAALTGQQLPVFGSGAQTRSFCYVSDLVDGLLKVAMDQGADGEVFNLGNPSEITMIELARLVARLTGHSGEIITSARESGDPERRRPDISKVRSRYGWEPAVSLEDGIRLTLDYFRSVLESEAAG